MARIKSKCFESKRNGSFVYDVSFVSVCFMSVRVSVIVMFFVVCDGLRLTIWAASVDPSKEDFQQKYKDMFVLFMFLCVCLSPSIPERYGVAVTGE